MTCSISAAVFPLRVCLEDRDLIVTLDVKASDTVGNVMDRIAENWEIPRALLDCWPAMRGGKMEEDRTLSSYNIHAERETGIPGYHMLAVWTGM